VALAAAMALAEALRGTVLTGFPWALPAYAWLETPVMQAAALMGPFALSGLTLLVALLPAAAGWRGLALAAALVATGWAWGGARLSAPAPADGPVIRLVQPNIGQRDKWLPKNRGPIFRTLLDLTARPAAAPPALVVWPEVAITFTLEGNADAVEAAVNAAPGPASVAIGAVRFADAPGRVTHNSLHFLDAEGAPLGVYDKRRLAPFGEYVPYALVLGRLGLGTLGDGLSGFSPGAEPGPFALPGLPPAAVLICYEIIFPGLTRRTAAGADWIIQVTNDAWFGDSFGPWQHLAQARIRAIETGLPVARAANTGVSAMIAPHGRAIATLGLGRRGVLDAALPGRLESPPYARFGEAISALLLACATVMLVARGRA
jgi:apolipoprotein N-acyltransferase